MKLDILVLAAHPDDAELSCSGIILNQISKGQKVGVVDLTQGELGTRGSVEIRYKEAEKAKQILGVSARENLALRDGFFENNEESIYKLIKVIRKYQPDIIITNTPQDRHPDHGRSSELTTRAIFLSGLTKIDTDQQAWRPNQLYYYIQDKWLKPDIVVDISPFWEKKVASILAYRSQFYSDDMDHEEPETYISSQSFLKYIEARARETGRFIGVEFAEGLIKGKPIGVNDLRDIL